MAVDLTNDDREKIVVAGTERIGTVTDVQGGTAYVEPDFEHVPPDLREALGWTGDGPYTIDEDRITTVQNTELRLRDDLFRNA